MMVHVLLGGTGTLGQELTRLLLRETNDQVRILARGECRLNEMRQKLAADPDWDRRTSFFIGDVRDSERLRRALTGADYVYHLAALKHVHTCEYDVLEAMRTNVEGTANVVKACLDTGVKKAVLVSTDKAVEPTTTYGITKAAAERIFIHGNSYGGAKGTCFFAVRYGNVMASNGSVLQLWEKQAENGQPLTLVDPQMTRFWWKVGEAAQFVYKCLGHARPGDIYVPAFLPACNLEELAEMVVPGGHHVAVAGNPMEKIHESMIASHEVAMATCMTDGTVRISMLQEKPASEPDFDSRLCSADHKDLEGVLCRFGP